MQILIKILKCNNSNAQYCAIILEKDVLFVFFMDKKKADFNGISTSTSEDVLSKRIVEHVELV